MLLLGHHTSKTVMRSQNEVSDHAKNAVINSYQLDSVRNDLRRSTGDGAGLING